MPPSGLHATAALCARGAARSLGEGLSSVASCRALCVVPVAGGRRCIPGSRRVIASSRKTREVLH